MRVYGRRCPPQMEGARILSRAMACGWRGSVEKEMDAGLWHEILLKRVHRAALDLPNRLDHWTCRIGAE